MSQRGRHMPLSGYPPVAVAPEGGFQRQIPTEGNSPSVLAPHERLAIFAGVALALALAKR
ncbi:MAG: hypothetical protein PUP93_34125 [Rhizonema sp. NSF051]|nr:hypothetical protein [Rhizonema sp. NSF051]